METFQIFGQEGDLDSCGDLSGRNLLDRPEDLSDRESEVLVDGLVVLVVADVPVFPSSSSVMVFPWILIGNLLSRSPFLSTQSVRFIVQLRRKR